MVLATGIGSPASCQTLQLGVFGSDAARVQAIFDELIRAPYVSDVPLVIGSRPGDAAPVVVACRVPAGVAQTPNQSGDGDGVNYASPTDAADSLPASPPESGARGYLEIRLPDGSLVYGAQTSNGAFVTVVHVIPAAGGWQVSGWEASGC